MVFVGYTFSLNFGILHHVRNTSFSQRYPLCWPAPPELADDLLCQLQRLQKINPAYWHRAESFLAASPCPGVLSHLPAKWDLEHYIALLHLLRTDFELCLAGLFLHAFELKLHRYEDMGYLLEDYPCADCAREVPHTLVHWLAPVVGVLGVEHPYFEESIAQLLKEYLQALSTSSSVGGAQ